MELRRLGSRGDGDGGGVVGRGFNACRHWDLDWCGVLREINCLELKAK